MGQASTSELPELTINHSPTIELPKSPTITPRSPISATMPTISASPRSPIVYASNDGMTPSSLINRDSFSYCQTVTEIPLSLQRTESLSYSQRLGIAADAIDLPKKMDDDEIIYKNQTGKSKSKSKKKKNLKKRKNEESYSPLASFAVARQKSVSSSRSKTNGKHAHNHNPIGPSISPKNNNGIVGKYISAKIANCAALFWINNIDVLPRTEQLEIGCVQYFHLLQQHPQLNKFFKKEKIEETALRFFDMFGWLIRSLNLECVNLWRVLANIGQHHSKMGLKVHHYELLLEAIHFAMSQSFPQNYTIQVKYCIDQVYTIATCIMTGRQYQQLSTHFAQRILDLNQCQFLENLATCLNCEVGTEYLYRYLDSTYCSEIVIFLKLCEEYNDVFSQHHIEKLAKANEIAKISLSPNSEFPVNVSYTAICEFWSRLRCCQRKCDANPDDFIIDSMLFDTVSVEIKQLILSNHWLNFTHTIKKMQRQNSFVNK